MRQQLLNRNKVQAYTTSWDVTIYTSRASLLMERIMQGEGTRARQVQVIRKVRENNQVASILMQKPDLMTWKPGQFAFLRLKMGTGWSEPRPFTLSCSPVEKYLQMTVKNSGNFTSRVHQLQPGDEVLVSGPYGKFCREIDNQGKLLLIAGGVGITPFLSVLRDLVQKDQSKDICLFWVNKNREDVFALQELSVMTAKLYLTLIFSFTKEDVQDYNFSENAFLEYGRLSLDVLQKYTFPWERFVYLCGPSRMQESVCAELNKGGVEKSTVNREAFV